MGKDIYKINDGNLTYGRGYVYSLQYHIVWCTKYRKQVLKNGLDERLKELLMSMADEYSFTITAMEVMPDHIHLLPASVTYCHHTVRRVPQMSSP